MSSHNMPDGTVIVVATGAEAKFFHARAKGDGLSLEADGSLKPSNLADEGPSGKRPPDSPDRETDEATFAKQLAHHLYELSHNKDEMRFVLVIDPDTLGEIRLILHTDVEQKIILEIPKTLIGQSPEEIAAIVANAS